MEDLVNMHQFNDIYSGRRVLITGNTGFKGSWLSLWLTELGAQVIGVSNDIPTDPSHFKLLKLPFQTIFADINDLAKLNTIFNQYQPEIVFHLAAQSLVRPSYRDPIETFQTNVMGTVNVLEAIRQMPPVKAAIIVTSDKCYENQNTPKRYKEDDKLGGIDPYSASKSCAEIVTQSYRESFFKNSSTLIATTRAGNVIGGGDWSEDRLIPDIFRSISANKPLILRNPTATRPWQHVLDPLSGYLVLGQILLEGSQAHATAYNFGPDSTSTATVEDVVKLAKKHWSGINIAYDTDSKLHEASLLNLDSSKALNQLAWKPTWLFDQAVFKTLEWYSKYLDDKKTNIVEESIKQLHEYIYDAQQKQQLWLKN